MIVSASGFRMPSQDRFFLMKTTLTALVTLTPVKIEAKHRFPRGSLKKYVTPESDHEMLQILNGCVQGPVE